MNFEYSIKRAIEQLNLYDKTFFLMGQYELFENRINSFKYECTIVVGKDNSSVET